jgi:dihydroflavonol-4-reductase
MNILVTGSSGFIGSHLCRALLAHGHSVRAFHRATSSLRGLDGLEVEHAIGDLTQPASLSSAMEGIEVVFHAGAMLGVTGDPAKMYAVTVEGTRAVLQAAQQAGVRRVVHTSSVAALGVPESGPVQNGTLALIDESHTWNYTPDRWPYGYAKYLAELEVQKAVAEGLDVVIVNPSGVFGPGDIYRTSSSLVVQIARGRIPAVVPGGWNIIHIDDVIAGHLAALERGRRGERYILASHNMTFMTFVNLIASVTHARPVTGTIPTWMAHAAAWPLEWLRSFLDLPFDGQLVRLAGNYFYYDASKSHQELGLEEPRPALDAIQEAWDWFQAPQTIHPTHAKSPSQPASDN